MRNFFVISLLTLFSIASTDGFSVSSQLPTRVPLNLQAAGESVELSISMPPSGSGLQANMRIVPILSVPSKIVEVRYKVPFGLNVAPKNQLCVCTKDGAGGEKKGDVLRFASQWTIGLPSGDGLLSTAASFSGGVSWQCSLFNVLNAKSWEQVVEALTSNVEVIALEDCADWCVVWMCPHHFPLNSGFFQSHVQTKLFLSSNEHWSQHPN